MRALMRIGHTDLQTMSTVLLVDDHPIVVAACRLLLEGAGITTVFDARDAASGYRAFVERNPDVVVVDLRLQDEDVGGLALIERIRSFAPRAAILVFSMHLDPIVIGAAISAGATGYLHKDAPPEELATAVAQVRSGQRYMDQRLAARVALRRVEITMAGLTPREREVLDLFAAGKTYSNIADELGINYKTVSNVAYGLRRKLGAKGLPDLIRKAIELTRPGLNP
jgi:DNA-binding NarL/FixJ family response regulator